MKPVHDYLRICHTYCNYLGGLRWSQIDNTVEYGTGDTFAFTQEIAQFLEGFARDRLLHFGYVLHLLSFLKEGRRAPPEAGALRLRRAFLNSHGTMRNAGVFFATLCHDVPEVPGGPSRASVCERLRDEGRPLRWTVYSASDSFTLVEFPLLDAPTFEATILRQVKSFRQVDLEHWFRHGTGPVKEAGRAIAEQLPLPQTLEGLLAAVLDRPRLAGARSLVPQLVSALTLPRPHQMPQELPMGGYADVVTRGNVDQILPAQFALDELEFFRRHAEQELLHYRREEPHTRTRRELVLVLDQGVRTWGEVRLVLAAAVIAFGRQAARGKMPFLLATTSAGRLVDPIEVGNELGELLEASDLSAEPGRVLGDVLQQSTGRERDVVLLTHPRNLPEPGVVEAARKVAAPTRLFSLGLEVSGQAELAEIRHGHAVSVRQFRVDLASLHEVPAPQPVQREDGQLSWSGAVEPIGYPFRFGQAGPLIGDLFAFDQEGERLVVVSQGGMLHAWNTDGSGWEIMPRALVEGKVFMTPKVLVGVAGGFVLVGIHNDRFAVMHYDFARRVASIHTHTPSVVGSHRFDFMRVTYMPRYYTIIIDSRPETGTYCALDLATGEWFERNGKDSGSRVRNAWEDYPAEHFSRNWLKLNNDFPPVGAESSPFVNLEYKVGTVHVYDPPNPTRLFVPLADGQPLLKGSHLLDGQCRGHILVVKVDRCAAHAFSCVLVFRHPGGELLAHHPLRQRTHGFALSANGEYLAIQTGPGTVKVFHVGEGAKARFTAFQGSYPQSVNLYLYPNSLILHPGGTHYHVVEWKQGKLEWTYSKTKPASTWAKAHPSTRILLDRTHKFVPSYTAAGLLPFVISSYPERFVQVVESHALVAALDRFGQLSILDRNYDLVCMIFARRQQIGFRMPDGTRAGSANLTGGPPTPGAMEKIGRALLRASEGGIAL